MPKKNIAKNLNPSPKNSIENLHDLQFFLENDPRYQSWNLDSPDSSILSASHEGLTKIFLSESLWLDQERVEPFLNSLDEENFMLVLLGKDHEFQSLPEHLKKPEIQLLHFPITSEHFHMSLQNFHRFQMRLHQSAQEKQAVLDDTEHVKVILSISRELNGIRDVPKLLSLILSKARQVTGADAGTIYTVETPPSGKIKEGKIHFKFTQNDSVMQNLSEFSLPVSESSIVGKSVLHGITINIPDLYKLSDDPKKNPYGVVHAREWDKKTGYECHSMCTLPIYDISHQVIGVIQLINRKKNLTQSIDIKSFFENQVVPFDIRDLEIVEIVAQQAGIALENALLTASIQNLFESFVQASVKAIEQRDPTTSGHSHRVAKLTLEIAKIVDRVDDGPYAHVRFTKDQIKEIEYASLLHDFGKLGVREHVLVKSKKLYDWEFLLIEERFEHIRSLIEVEYLSKCQSYSHNPGAFPPGIGVDYFRNERDKKLIELEEVQHFILKVNEPTILEQGGFEKLKDIANFQFMDTRGRKRTYLLRNELEALSVSRGSLTPKEFSEIQNHVNHTYDFLRQIPWGKNLANVPQIAAKHHEKLDGSGYPTSCAGGEIPIQSRMMTIADIFDALTASDRPYKKAVPPQTAMDIIHLEVKGGKCDKELFRLFVESKIYLT